VHPSNVTGHPALEGQSPGGDDSWRRPSRQDHRLGLGVLPVVASAVMTFHSHAEVKTDPSDVSFGRKELIF